MIVRMKSDLYYDIPVGLIGYVLYDFMSKAMDHYYVVKWPMNFVCEVEKDDVELIDESR